MTPGKNDWLFYTGEHSLELYQNALPLSASDLAVMKERIEGRRDRLAAKGVGYEFVIAPDKHTIYPEFMSDRYLRRPRPSQYSQTMEMAKAAGLPVVDLRPALLAAKAHAQVYLRDDTHWNDIGVSAAMGPILAAMAPKFDRQAPVFTDGDFEMKALAPGDLAEMALINRRETAPMLKESSMPCKFQVVEKDWDSAGRKLFTRTHCPGAKGKVLVIYDSFGDALVPFLAAEFGDMYAKWTRPTDKQFDQLVATEKPDFVIEERAERSLSANPELRSKAARPGRAQGSVVRRRQRRPQMFEQARLVGAEHALERQPVGGVVAAEHRAFELQGGKEALHLLEQAHDVERRVIGEFFAEPRFSHRKADHQGRQEFGLGRVHQPRRIQGVLRAERGPAKAVEDHHRAPDPGRAQFLQRFERRGERLALVDAAQNFVVARFRADIDEGKAQRGKFAKLRDRFPGDVARQAIARHPPHAGHLTTNRYERRDEPPGRKGHGVAIGEKDAPDLVAKGLAAAPDGFENFGLVARAEFLLRRRVHFAERAAVPRTAVGQGQDERVGFARRAIDGLDIADGKVVHEAVPAQKCRAGA